MKKTFSSRWVICICMAVMGSTTAFGDLVNGDFSIADVLHPDFGWMLSGGAQVEGGKAVFEEEDAPFDLNMTLSQDVTLESGNYILSYDIFFSSSVMNESDLFEVLWGGTPLLSMNNEGLDDYTSLYGLTEGSSVPDEILYFGTVEHPIAVSTLWTTLEFRLSPDNTGRTFVSIDNVEIVPVPSAVILGSLGLTFSGWMLKRKRMR